MAPLCIATPWYTHCGHHNSTGLLMYVLIVIWVTCNGRTCRANTSCVKHTTTIAQCLSAYTLILCSATVSRPYTRQFCTFGAANYHRISVQLVLLKARHYSCRTCDIYEYLCVSPAPVWIQKLLWKTLKYTLYYGIPVKTNE